MNATNLGDSLTPPQEQQQGDALLKVKMPPPLISGLTGSVMFSKADDDEL